MENLINKVWTDQEILNEYSKGNRSLREIANKLGTNHHTVKRVLKRHNIEYKEKQYYPKPRSYYYPEPKYKSKEDRNRGNMVSHLHTKDLTIKDIEKYEDFEKLKFLNKCGIYRKDRYGFKHDKNDYIAYIDKFYNESYFNKIYQDWLSHNKNKWYRPTLDHIIPRSRGGTSNLDNLQFLTWFENRAKAEMTQQEWNEFKLKTNTKSSLFRS